MALLLEHKSDPNCQDRYNNSPLHYAAWGGTESIFTMLFRAKADPDVTSVKGNTVLHAAAHGGSLPLVKILVEEHGLDPTIPTLGNTLSMPILILILILICLP